MKTNPFAELDSDDAMLTTGGAAAMEFVFISRMLSSPNSDLLVHGFLSILYGAFHAVALNTPFTRLSGGSVISSPLRYLVDLHTTL